MKRIRTVLPGVLVLLMVCGGMAEQSPEDKGLAITREADRRNTGFDDVTANLLMVLMNKHGQKSERQIRIQTLEVPTDGDKTLMIFDTPRDVKGTAFLSFTHKVGDDDQWLYLPAVKRVKRISGRNKSGSFMGSEFSYEDIASQELEKYSYKWIRDESLEGQDCFVIEQYAVDSKNSGYSKQVIWRDKQAYRVRRAEYYDRKGSLLKTLTCTGYRKYLDRYWHPDEMYMVNHQTGKSTRLVMSDYQFRTGLKDSDFNQNSLRRAR